jgi:hypothetical protein
LVGRLEKRNQGGGGQVMMWLRSIFLAAGLFVAIAPAARGREAVYSGPWKTTNRKLDGTMTCTVRKVGKEKWQGRFWGTWQGVDFDYNVDFSGPPDHLRGTAIIDGVPYEWKGRISAKQFRANFGGDRYSGSFDLQRDETPAAVMRSEKSPKLRH